MYAVFIFATPWLVCVVMGILAYAAIMLAGYKTFFIITVKKICAGTYTLKNMISY